VRKETLAFCLTLLAVLMTWSPGEAQDAEAKDPSCQQAMAAGDTTGATPALEIFGYQTKNSGWCVIHCNTYEPIYCYGSGYYSCGDGLDSNGYYIQCDDVRYYCPPCPSWDPQHCLN
jgi:hypothetical protein